MRRVTWAAAGIAALGLPLALGLTPPASANAGPDAAPMVIAQMPPGGQGGPGGMSQEDMQKMQQQMLDRMLAQSGMTAQEQAAAKQTIKTKQQAKKTLDNELAKLRQLTTNSEATEADLTSALATFRTALGEYRKKMADADVALIRQLSVSAQAWCTTAGVLDNGGTMMGAGGGGRGQGGQGGQGGPGYGPPPQS